MATEIKLRRDISTNWTSTNPILAQGEPGYETDTGQLKLGDGTTAWASLAYQAAANIVDGTIVNADINASAGIVDTKLATIATAGKVSNSATTATDANTASAIVARDASGNFTAGTITAALTGAASSNVLKAGDTMTGALVHPLGAVGTPSITFTGDLNTGFYSPAADTLAAVTAGSNRLHITSAGLVGIGISDPSTLLTLGTNAPRLEFNDGDAATDNKRWQFFTGSTSFGFRALTDAGAAGGNQFSFTRSNENINSFQGIQSGAAWFHVDNSTARVGIGTTSPGAALEINAAAATSPFIAKINTAEAARIDSSGRLLVGTSSARANFYNGANTAQIQLEGTNFQNAAFAIVCNANSDDKGSLILAKNRGTTVGSNTIVQDGDDLGSIEFQGSDGAEFVQAAAIKAEVDGTPGANDMPGRLVFSTTADGASSPTERMRINSAGNIITTGTFVDPAITGTILEDVFTITDGAAFEVDPGNGSIQLITLGASRTPKATNFAAGESITLMVADGTAYTITWTDATWGTGGVIWKGGTAPTLATTGYSVIQFWKVSTQVYGAYVGNVA